MNTWAWALVQFAIKQSQRADFFCSFCILHSLLLEFKKYLQHLIQDFMIFSLFIYFGLQYEFFCAFGLKHATQISIKHHSTPFTGRTLVHLPCNNEFYTCKFKCLAAYFIIQRMVTNQTREFKNKTHKNAMKNEEVLGSERWPAEI